MTDASDGGVAERIAALETRLTELEDIQAIQRVKWEHALASDDQPNLVERFLAIVTDDFEADYGEAFGTIHGKDELRKFLAHSPFVWTIHYMIPKRIDIARDGRTAEAIWYLWEPALFHPDPAARKRAVWLGAVYQDSYAKQADGSWKIRSIKFDARLMAPYDKGWEEAPVVDLGAER